MALKRAPSRSSSVPPPVGGWNAREPLDAMQPTDAVELVNVFPDTTKVRIRRGFRSHSTGMGSGAVQSLFEYNSKTGTRKLIACANNNIYDATTFGATATSLKSTGITTNRWQGTNFNNKLILVNGLDQPVQYDGSTVTDAVYTGVTDENLINVSVYKNRLYFVEKNTASIWYGGVDAVTGALTQLDVNGQLSSGGYVLFAGSWSHDTGTGLVDLFVIVSHVGEVLVYSGSYPGDASWGQNARYFIPAPLGRRAVVPFGSDLGIITEAGLITMSQLLREETLSVISQTFTDKIRDAFTQAAEVYRNNFGWEAVVFSQGKMGIINIPVVETTTSEQYVVNSLNGSWCKFTGINAFCWALHNEKPYFGGAGGKVFEANHGNDDDGVNIETSIQCAFNYFNDRERNKRFVMARPLLMGDRSTSFTFDIATDFESKSILNVISVTGSGSSPWGSAWGSPWGASSVNSKNWYSISGLGRAGSLILKGNFKDIDFSLSAINVIYEPGGFI